MGYDIGKVKKMTILNSSNRDLPGGYGCFLDTILILIKKIVLRNIHHFIFHENTGKTFNLGQTRKRAFTGRTSRFNII